MTDEKKKLKVWEVIDGDKDNPPEPEYGTEIVGIATGLTIDGEE